MNEPVAASRIERLAGLCRIWGAAKFFHPYLAYREIDWDLALVEAIPLVSQATSAEDYTKGIAHLLEALDDRATRVATDEDLELADPFAPTSGGPTVEPSLLRRDGVAVLQAQQLFGLPPGPELMNTVEGWLKDMEDADALVFDLRGGGGYWFVLQQLQAVAPRLLDGQVPQPATRTRMHSGYTTDGGGSGGYSSGFYVTDALTLDGLGGPLATKPLVVVLDHIVGAPDWVTALHSIGRARVVFVGDPEITIAPHEMIRLPDGVCVLMRTGEQIFSDGGLGFAPDVVVTGDDEEGDYFDSRAMTAALAAVAAPREQRTRRRLDTLVIPYRRDKRYEDTPFPALEYRLLALFRYWTIIDLFFPYREHLDRDWDDVLRDSIPIMEAAEDETAYALALATVISKTSDTHCFLFSPVFHRWLGSHTPALKVRLIEDRTVVTHLPAAVAGLVVGDVVLSVDGQSTEARRDRLRPYIAASTPQAMEWRLHNMLLDGAEGTEAVLEIERADGERATVRLVRDQTYVPPAIRDLPTYGVLPSGFGYFDLARLLVQDVDDAFEAVRDTPALIIDDRCYPNGTAWALAPRLATFDGEFVGALFGRPEPRSPNRAMNTSLRMEQTLPASDKWRYTKPVVMLINGEAISQAEHTCLLIEAACKPTFIGSATNGANGDVTSIQLPGGARTMFSGHEVRHADGRQLQRVGIQPDIEVHPTIAGIRAARDEVLEAAVEFLAREN